MHGYRYYYVDRCGEELVKIITLLLSLIYKIQDRHYQRVDECFKGFNIRIQHSYIKTFLKRKHQDTGKCDRCLKAYKHFYHLCMF